MILKADYEFIFVGKDDSSFLEHYSYDLFEDFGHNSGQIFINIEIQNNPVDSEEIGQAIFDAMQSVFFEDLEKEPYDRFETALKEVNRVLKDFRSQKRSGYIGNLSMIISAVVGNNLLLAQCGDAEAYLVRKRYVSIISDGLNEENSDDVFGSIASGSIEQGDFVLFSTSRLLRYISKTDLARAMNKGDIRAILEEIKDVVSTEILGRIGLCGMLFSRLVGEDEENALEQNDQANMTVLSATNNHIIAEKEAITGRFFSALRKAKNPDAKIWYKTRYFFGKMASFGSLFLPKKDLKKGKTAYILALIIVVLIGGVFYVKERSAVSQEMDKQKEILSSVQSKIAEANTKSSYDKESAKTILDKAYADSMAVLNSGYFREKAKEYLIDIEKSRDDIDGVIRVENPQVYSDISEKRSDINALGFVEVGDRVFVYEYNALYELVLNQLQDPLTIDDKEEVIAATGFDDRGSVVFLTKNGKLLEFRDGNMSFMDSDDGSFHKGVALADWSNRIYVLDNVKNQIWRYTYKGTREKFGTAEGYLVKAGDQDLSDAVSFAIDANVYLINKKGDLWKFYAGSKANFYINNPPFNNFTDPKAVYTDENLDQVYVVDGGGKRVFVYDKDIKTGNLNYTKQYLLEVDEDLRDVYMNPDEGKMYVLSKSKIYEVSL